MHHWLAGRIPGADRFGRRTLVLLHCGGTWVVFGWAILAIPTERFSRPGPGGALQILDTPYWGWLWIVGGAMAIVNAPLRKRWRGRDALGFTGIVTPCVGWFLAYMWSAIAHFASGGDYGNPRAAIGILVWYLMSAFVLIVAGWPDPDDPAISSGRRANDTSP